MNKAIEILESVNCKTTMNYDDSRDQEVYYRYEDVLEAINRALTIQRVTNHTYKCLGCKHYNIKIVNDKGGTSKTCNVNKNDVRVIVDLSAPNCNDYVFMHSNSR